MLAYGIRFVRSRITAGGFRLQLWREGALWKLLFSIAMFAGKQGKRILEIVVVDSFYWKKVLQELAFKVGAFSIFQAQKGSVMLDLTSVLGMKRPVMYWLFIIFLPVGKHVPGMFFVFLGLAAVGI